MDQAECIDSRWGSQYLRITYYVFQTSYLLHQAECIDSMWWSQYLRITYNVFQTSYLLHQAECIDSMWWSQYLHITYYVFQTSYLLLQQQYHSLTLLSLKIKLNKQPMAVMLSWQHRTYKPCTLGYDDIFGLWSEFIRRSVYARLQDSTCSNYTVFQKKWRQNRNHNNYYKSYQN